MTASDPRKVAVREDRTRVGAILTSPEAKAKPNAAIAFALGTDMSVREARKALAAAPADRPNAAGRPHVEPDFLTRSDDTSKRVAVSAPGAPAGSPQSDAAVDDSNSAESILALARAVGIPGLKARDEQPSAVPADDGGAAGIIALAKSVGLRGFGEEAAR